MLVDQCSHAQLQLHHAELVMRPVTFVDWRKDMTEI